MTYRVHERKQAEPENARAKAEPRHEVGQCVCEGRAQAREAGGENVCARAEPRHEAKFVVVASRLNAMRARRETNDDTIE